LFRSTRLSKEKAPGAKKNVFLLPLVVVNAGGAPKGRERSNPRRYMGLEVHS
jgi:hypothetical protein